MLHAADSTLDLALGAIDPSDMFESHLQRAKLLTQPHTRRDALQSLSSFCTCAQPHLSLRNAVSTTTIGTTAGQSLVLFMREITCSNKPALSTAQREMGEVTYYCQPDQINQRQH